METILVIIAVALFLMVSPYLTYFVNLLTGVVPPVIMKFIVIGIAIKTVLFVIHRGSEG